MWELHSIQSSLKHTDFVFSPAFTQIQEFFPPRPALQAGLGSLCGRDAITHVSSCWSSSPVPLPHDKRRGKQLSCELCRGQERWWDSCLQTDCSHGTDSCRRRAPLLWDSCGIDLKPGKRSKAIPRAQKSRERSEERARRDWAGSYGIPGKRAELVGSVPPDQRDVFPLSITALWNETRFQRAAEVEGGQTQQPKQCSRCPLLPQEQFRGSQAAGGDEPGCASSSGILRAQRREAKANRCWRVYGFNKQLFVRAVFNSGSQRELRRDAEQSQSWKIPPKAPNGHSLLSGWSGAASGAGQGRKEPQ